jgi:thiol-disulfide isomerase/thioredoxin
MKFVLLFVLSLTTAALAQDSSWRDLPLTDAQTGETFTLADFAGKTVYVEPMATWCANCRQQLGNVREAKEQLGDEVTFIALSVETTLTADELARYADDQGFDFTFAVMTPEVLRALAAEFGQSITSPPATPHFVIHPDGSTSELLTGSSTADEIVAVVQQ